MEQNKKGIEKFKETHDWSKYCYDAKLRRIERLKEQGCKNPWAVATGGAEPKYDYMTEVKSDGRMLIPFRVREELGIKYGSVFKITTEGNKIILERVDSNE